MQDITVEPLVRASARLKEIAEPDIRNGTIHIEEIAEGICGSDIEIAGGKYGPILLIRGVGTKLSLTTCF